MICHICRSDQRRTINDGPTESIYPSVIIGGVIMIDVHPSCIRDALAFVGKLMAREGDPERIAAMERLKEMRDNLARSPFHDSKESPDELPYCTSMTSTWCPVHGDCDCPRDESFERSLDDPSCPLHSEESAHASVTRAGGEAKETGS